MTSIPEWWEGLNLPAKTMDEKLRDAYNDGYKVGYDDAVAWYSRSLGIVREDGEDRD